jgi:ubiquitin-protein ligase
MSLPPELLRTRLMNELALCRESVQHDIGCSDEDFSFMPVSLDVQLRDVPGPVLKDGVVVDSTEHRLKIIITENYPYEKPIVRWQTSIFHPNIMLPRDGGYVCTKLLDNWSFSSNLLSFIKGVESLLANPNPMNPYKTDSCMLASERFLSEPYQPKEPTVKRRLPRIVP